MFYFLELFMKATNSPLDRKNHRPPKETKSRTQGPTEINT
jgi:hypothetical protein